MKKRKKESRRLLIMGFLLVGACLLTYYSHHMLQKGLLFSHLLYVPIALACFWWGRKGVVIPLFLGVMLLLSSFHAVYDNTFYDLLRAIMFLIVGAIIARLSERVSEMKNLYYALANSSQVGIYVVQDGKIVFANHHIPRYAGYSMDALIGSKIISYVVPEDRMSVRENASKMLKGEITSPYEYRIIDKQGRIRWLMESVTSIRHKGMPAVLGNTVEITEIKEIQNKLKETEKLYRTITNTSRSGIYIVQDRTFQFINHGTEMIAGYSQNEMVGMEASTILHPDDKEMARKNARMMLKGEITSPYEFRIIDKDGRVKWIMETVTSIDCRGRPAVLGNSMDISELKEARERLKTMENREYSILSAIPLAVLGLKDRHVVFANSAVENIYGWKPFELTGKKTRVLYRNDDDFEEIGRKVYATLEEQKVCNLEVPCRHKNGRDITCMLSTAVIGEHLEDNNIIAVYEDITDRKQAEDDLRKSKDQLERSLAILQTTQAQLLQSEKLASVGQLAAGVAHEINNPTAFVSSNLKTLNDYFSDIIVIIEMFKKFVADLKYNMDDGSSRSVITQLRGIEEKEREMDIDFVMNDISDLIKESREGTDRITKIVQDLKNFAHPGEGDLEYVDINKNLESTLNVVWNELKYKATVEKEYGELPTVECHPQKLNQVFMNILVNAAQAIKEKGTITITTRANGKGQVEVDISDTGMGISEENLSKIFDPFFTTKGVGKGTGLGLHIAYDIVHKHNGSIDVESRVGEGTTFKIRIPVDRESALDD